MKRISGNSNFDILSPLESDVLNELWPDGKLRVRDIYQKLRKQRKVALTSIAVILDRLFEKGVVNRQIETARGGLRYVYFPKQDKDQFEKSVVEQTVNKLIANFGDAAISYFNERFVKSKK
ncbi:MAG TPA: BlaI/MecI/CopY family transcriptional regulator [Candidatus Nanoarchaeia archaeon]|nr:BlaI/MecI/CopY family transcriptional regulator [Candidatus Nanoarchaeia archaeon]